MMSDLTPQLDDARYRLLVDAITDYAIYMLDADGRVASWNAGAQRFKGYTAAEIIGRISAASTPRRTAPRARRAGLRTAAETAATRSRAGACARTAAVLGASWSSTPIRDGRRADRLRQGHPRPHRAKAAEESCAERAAVPAAGQGVTDYAIYMLDRDGRREQLERRRRAHQGLPPRRDRRPALLPLLHRRGPRRRRCPTRAWRRAARGPLRGEAGGCARTAAASGPRGDRRDPRRDGRVIGFAKITRDITERLEAQRSLERPARR
jgi:PAS domain S-box-containing protein